MLSLVYLCGSKNVIVLHLFNPMRKPANDPRHCKERGEKVSKNKAKSVKKPAVKAKRPIAKVKKKPAKPAKKITKSVKKSAVKAKRPIRSVVKKRAPVAAMTAKARVKVGEIKTPAGDVPLPVVSKKSDTKIGTVTHYYAQIGVAVVQLDQQSLRVGDTIKIKGHTTDFTQPVESMEVEHQPVSHAKAGDLFGLKVTQHVRVSDSVYLM